MLNYANTCSLLLVALTLFQEVNAGITQGEVVKRARGIYAKHNSDTISRERANNLINSVNAANYVKNPENFNQNPEDLESFLGSLVSIAENIKDSEAGKFNAKLNDVEKQLRKMSKTDSESSASEGRE